MLEYPAGASIDIFDAPREEHQLQRVMVPQVFERSVSTPWGKRTWHSKLLVLTVADVPLEVKLTDVSADLYELCHKHGDKLLEQLFAPPDLRAAPHRQEAFKILYPWIGPAYLDPERCAPQPGERLRLVPWHAGGYDTTQALKRLRN